MDKLLALRASAGSGKTFALSVRYISLLFLGANPNSIIALTFTKKAANEMQERIFSTLQNLEGSDELEEICKLTKKSKDEILKQKHRVINSFMSSSLHIQTIDAFFAKILRKFSLHLGIMPDFTPTDISFDGRLEELFVKSLDGEEFKAMVDFMVQERKNAQSVFEYFVSLYEKSKEFEFKAPSVNTYLSKDEVLVKAREIYEYLRDIGAPAKVYNIFNTDSLEALLKKTFWQYEYLNNRTYANYHSSELDRLYLELKKTYGKYCKQKEAYILGKIFNLFKRYEEVKFNLITQTNELSFSDISFLTHQLLTKNISSEFLYFRLDSQIEHLLIDEFQDTNVVQFDILSPIIEEISSGIGSKEDKSFFYVGDVKQSIYRFRGGSKELFNSVAKRYGIKIDSLDTNYRSKRNLVGFVGVVFKDIYSDFEPQDVKERNENQGYIKVMFSDELLKSAYESVEYLLSKGVAGDDIALLTQINADALELKEYLLEQNDKLKVSIESTKPLKNTPKVKAIIEFLKFSYFGFRLSEKNALVLLGNSFEDSLQTKISNFSKPMEQLVLDAIELLSIDVDTDVLRFLEVVKEYGSVQELLYGLDKLNEPSTNSDTLGIKILTVHKSKGLEFKHVIVLDKIGRKNNQNGTFLFDYEEERLRDIYVRMSKREYVDEEYKKAKQKDDVLCKEDMKNAAYVAFTRAKDSLIVIQKTKSSSLDFLKLSEFEMGEVIVSEQESKQKHIKEFEKIISYGSQEEKSTQKEIEYDLEATYFGLAFHYLLELTKDFTKDSLDKAFVGVKNRYGDLVDTNKVLTRAYMLVENESFKALVDGGKFYKEKAVMYKGERKQLDLLVELENEYIIIDYKTSEFVQNEHIAQVKAYKNALMYMGDKSVRAYLFYIKDDEVKRVEVE